MEHEIAVAQGSNRFGSRVHTAECSWTKIPDKFLSGWAGGVRDKFSLVGAQGKCVQLGAKQCGGVTCTKDLRECTVRKASQVFRSLSGEVSVPVSLPSRPRHENKRVRRSLTRLRRIVSKVGAQVAVSDV